MPKFKKKPIIIEAIQFGASGNATEAFEWAKDRCHNRTVYLEQGRDQKYYMMIDTLEGTHRADMGDWIICGVKGELYPCKPDIFEATYDAVAEH